DQMQGGHVRYALRWRGLEESRVIDPDDVRPGDTLVVPAFYGGYERFGWNPYYDKPVRDVADYVASQQRGKYALRLHPDLISQWFEAENSRSEAVLEAVKAQQNALTRYKQEDLSQLCDELIERLLAIPGLRTDIREALNALQIR